eukprot:scaffold13576_cov125-Isochrysis_galbana.AAC.2
MASLPPSGSKIRCSTPPPPGKWQRCGIARRRRPASGMAGGRPAGQYTLGHARKRPQWPPVRLGPRACCLRRAQALCHLRDKRQFAICCARPART